MASRKDYTGIKFGRLTVISFSEMRCGVSYWNMKCDCGNNVIVRITNAVSGSTKSCGCLRHEVNKKVTDKLINFNKTRTGPRSDISNQKYNRLTAIHFVRKHGRGQAIWLFSCDCGESLEIESYRVIRGSIKSCGCLHKELGRINIRTKFKIPYGKAAENNSYKRYKDSAKKRQIDFLLTKDEVGKLFRENCHYCGSVPSIVSGSKHYNGEFIRNGIDRIDSNGPYSLDNCVTCCSKCNYAKGTMSYNEFIDWAVKLYNHLTLKLKKIA